jgi:hypothetical protein
MTLRNRSANIGGAVITSTGITLSTGTDLSTQANDAYSAANTANTNALTAYGQANTAYAQANAARSDANTTFATVNTTFGTVNTAITNAHNQANAAYSQANSARSDANTTFSTINTTFGTTNTAITNAHNQANAAYGQANTARSDANTTFNTINTTFGTVNTAITNAHNQANAAFNAANGKLSLTGGAIFGDISVTGNLFVNGTETIVNTSSLTINDPIFLLANNNTTNAVGLGFVAHYGPTQQHTGLIRAHQDNNWYLFEDYDNHILYANNVLDVANVKLATLRANVNANSLLLVGNAVATQANLTLAHNQANTARNQANTAYDQANSAFTAANNRVLKAGDTMTGLLTVSVPTNNVVSQAIQLIGNRNYGAGDNGGAQIFATGSGGTVGTHDYGAIKFYARGFSGTADGGGGIVSLHVGGSSSNSTSNGMFIQADGGLGSTGNVKFYTGDSVERMRITATGSVGIGTTNPIRTLTVAGGFAFAEPNGSARGLHWGDSTTGNVPVYIGGDATSSNTGIKFYVSPFGVASGTERMRITANGEIGIGTDSPGFLFDVSNTSTAVDYTAGRFISSAAGSGESRTWLKVEKGSNYGGAIGGYISQGVGSGVLFGTQNGSSTPTERMRITSGGNVGIGTTSTPWRFNVTGAVRSIQIRQSNTNNADKYSFMSAGHYTSDTYTDGFTLIGGIGSSGTNQVSIGGSVNEALAASLIAFYTAANNTTVTGSERMRINSSGDVSIGSAVNAGDTLRYLDVYNTNTGSSAGAITRLVTSNAAGTGLTTLDIVKYKTGGAIINNNEPSSSGFIGFNVSGGERMRITSAGNVGINVTSPAYAGLHLNTPSGDSILHITRAAQGTGATDGFSIGLGNDGNGYVFLREAAVLVFGTSNAERGRFSASGGFSLGTTADPGGGAIFATGEITAFYSDDRLKTKLGNIDNALGKVLSLNGFLYEPNETAIGLGYEKKVNVGVSAQEVNAILPEAVVAAPIDDKYMTVHYHKLVPLLIEAIKDLNAKVEQMQKVIDERK